MQNIQKTGLRFCDMDPGEQVFASQSLIVEYLHLRIIPASNSKTSKASSQLAEVMMRVVFEV